MLNQNSSGPFSEKQLLSNVTTAKSSSRKQKKMFKNITYKSSKGYSIPSRPQSLLDSKPISQRNGINVGVTDLDKSNKKSTNDYLNFELR